MMIFSPRLVPLCSLLLLLGLSSLAAQPTTTSGGGDIGGSPSNPTSGGGRPEDNVLFPQPNPFPIYVGGEVGYGWWSGGTSFTINDQALPCVSFAVGDGSGPVIGGKAFYGVLIPHLMVIPHLRMEVRNSSYTSLLPEEPTRGASDSVVMLRQEATVDAAVSALVGDVCAGWEFFGTGGYVFGGLGYNLQLGGVYDYSERILGPEGLLYSDTRSTEHTLVKDRPFPNYQTNVFDLRLGLGWLLPVGPVYINPEFTYRLPLSSALAAPEEMKQNGVMITVGAVYRLR